MNSFLIFVLKIPSHISHFSSFSSRSQLFAVRQYFSGGSLTPQEPMTCGSAFLFLSAASCSNSSLGAVGLNMYCVRAAIASRTSSTLIFFPPLLVIPLPRVLALGAFLAFVALAAALLPPGAFSLA